MSETAVSMGKDFILFASKASRLMKNDKIEHALTLCESGVRNFPFYAPGHYILGLCYDASGKAEEAKNEYERTLVYEPAHTKAMRKLSEFYRAAGFHQIADEWLLKEAGYSPLDEELINTLKEKNLYERLNPQSPDAPLAQEELVAEPVIESEAEIEIEPETEAESLNLDTVSPDEESIPVTESDEKDDPDINALDPLAENIVINEPREEGENLNQFANMEDDFSTIMNGYFDADEQQASPTADSEDWIEVENLLIDEEKPVAELPEETPVVEEESKPVTEISDGRDATDLLLEKLSDNEALESKTEEEPQEVKEETAAEYAEEVTEPVLSTKDTVPNPVSNLALSDNSGEEEVTVKDLMENPNLMTPTFGEILVAQRKFSEAKHIFNELLKREPENEKLQKKVDFLEKFLAAQQA